MFRGNTERVRWSSGRRDTFLSIVGVADARVVRPYQGEVVGASASVVEFAIVRKEPDAPRFIKRVHFQVPATCYSPSGESYPGMILEGEASPLKLQPDRTFSGTAIRGQLLPGGYAQGTIDVRDGTATGGVCFANVSWTANRAN